MVAPSAALESGAQFSLACFNSGDIKMMHAYSGEGPRYFLTYLFLKN